MAEHSLKALREMKLSTLLQIQMTADNQVGYLDSRTASWNMDSNLHRLGRVGTDVSTFPFI